MDVSTKPKYMFRHQVIDFFFVWRWYSAQLVFIPFALALALIAWAINREILTLSLTLLAGIFFWTFLEYCLHRFIFHFMGESPWLRHFHYVVHGMHHAHPTDPSRVIFPPFLGILFGLVIFVLLLPLMPLDLILGFLSGIAFGYSWYEFMHYASHHIKWRYSWFKRLKRHHLLHHHSDSFRNKNFGVTTSLWDRIFGTYLT